MAEAEKSIEVEIQRWRSLSLRLASHIHNTQICHPSTWSRHGCALLAEVRNAEADPDLIPINAAMGKKPKAKKRKR